MNTVTFDTLSEKITRAANDCGQDFRRACKSLLLSYGVEYLNKVCRKDYANFDKDLDSLISKYNNKCKSDLK
jgi:ABC-type branched-subunit amino acid transport system substrate-binding protein